MQGIVDQISLDSVHDSRDDGALPHIPASVHDLPQMYLRQISREETTFIGMKV
jgi:hypothetical protein